MENGEMPDAAPEAPADAPAEAEADSPTTATDEEAAKWKELSRKNERALKAAQRELDQLRQASMSEQEKAVAQAKAAGFDEGISKATERLRRAEVRAAAAGLLEDPDDAVHLLDLEKYQPNDDGEFDRKAMQADISALVKVKPYLGARPGNGSGEGGPRGEPPALALNGDPLLGAIKSKLGIA